MNTLTVGLAMGSSSLSCEDPLFVSVSESSLGNLCYAHKIKEARNKVKYVAELSMQDMIYFGILNFCQYNTKNTLQEALGINDYERFKAEFTANFETSKSARNTCKRILIRVEEAVNKKKALKDEKEKVLAWNDDTSKKMILWILKIMKFFYFNVKPVDYNNEDSYLYFVLSAIFKNLLGNHPRVSLLFEEANLKVKAIEVNRYLFDD